jgi:hypothetical protein
MPGFTTLPSGSHQTLLVLNNKRFRHFLVGPDLGEEFEVRLEKGKTLQVKLLTPGLSVSAAICCLYIPINFTTVIVMPFNVIFM